MALGDIAPATHYLKIVYVVNVPDGRSATNPPDRGSLVIYLHALQCNDLGAVGALLANGCPYHGAEYFRLALAEPQAAP